MEFRFLNGQRLYMKAKLNEIFKDSYFRSSSFNDRENSQYNNELLEKLGMVKSKR